MRTSIEQTEKKIEFIEDNFDECNFFFSVYYRFSDKPHMLAEGKAIIEKARSVLQYSCRTADCDILRFLYITWCKTKGFKPFP